MADYSGSAALVHPGLGLFSGSNMGGESKISKARKKQIAKARKQTIKETRANLAGLGFASNKKGHMISGKGGFKRTGKGAKHRPAGSPAGGQFF